MSKALTYSSYLRVDELLALQSPRSNGPNGPEHDELLFIIIHQVYELWFRQLIHELDYLQGLLRASDTPRAAHTLRRILTILKTIVSQIDILETMTPLEFNSFRGFLESASGFQSAQFRELEAVLAHELTHIRNGDARLGVIAAVFAGIISLVAEVVFRGMRGARGGSRGRGGGVAVLVALAILALAWLLAVVLRFALSRNREFLADAGAVELTANPDAMISALRKVEGRSDMPAIPSQVQAMLLDWPRGASGFNLWATHPSIEARVQALVAYAGGRDPGPIADPPQEEVPPPAAPAAGEAKRAASRSPWWRGPA